MSTTFELIPTNIDGEKPTRSNGVVIGDEVDTGEEYFSKVERSLEDTIVQSEIVWLLRSWIESAKLPLTIASGSVPLRLQSDSESILELDIAVYRMGAKIVKQRRRPLLDEPPILAVVIPYPTMTYGQLWDKTSSLKAMGTPLIWVVDCLRNYFTIHSKRGIRLAVEDDAMDDESVLPGFHVRAADFFPSN